MKIKTLVSAVTLGAATILTSSPALAVDTSSVTIVDGYQYDATSTMSHTVCLGDVEVKQDSDDILSTISIAPGTYTISVVQGGATCGDGEYTWNTAEVTVEDVANQTIAFGWPFERELPTWQESNVFDCVPNGQGQIVVRNYFSGDPDMWLSIGSQAPESDPSALISNVPVGETGSALVDPPAYPGADSGSVFVGYIEGNEWSDKAVTFTDQLDVDANYTTIVYAYGGADGDVGLVTQQIPNSGCEITPPSSSSTTTPSTLPPVTSAPTTTVLGTRTSAPVAATPVSATPTYTG